MSRTYKPGDKMTATRRERQRNANTGKWVEWSQKPFNGVVRSLWRGQYIVMDEKNCTTATYSDAELKAR
jgi:hypothetical protein